MPGLYLSEKRGSLAGDDRAAPFAVQAEAFNILRKPLLMQNGCKGGRLAALLIIVQDLWDESATQVAVRRAKSFKASRPP
jgi:hypothetical protein